MILRRQKESFVRDIFVQLIALICCSVLLGSFLRQLPSEMSSHQHRIVSDINQCDEYNEYEAIDAKH